MGNFDTGKKFYVLTFKESCEAYFCLCGSVREVGYSVFQDTVSSHTYAQSVSSDIRMKVGGERYCEPCFTLSDTRFRNDILSIQVDARCPELSV